MDKKLEDLLKKEKPDFSDDVTQNTFGPLSLLIFLIIVFGPLIIVAIMNS